MIIMFRVWEFIDDYHDWEAENGCTDKESDNARAPGEL
jgi:hypothetical protein